MNTGKIYDDIADCLTKQVMCEFLELSKKEARNTSMTDVKALFAERMKDESEFKRACITYPKETAITAYQLETILGCTKTERTRWTKEGKIAVVYYGRVKIMRGVYVDAPNYSRLYVKEHLNDAVLEEWRSEHIKEIANNRAKGRSKAAKTQKENDTVRHEFYEKYKNDLEEWYKHGENIGVAMQLGFWTMIVNRMAKSCKNSGKWYAYKEEAIEVLHHFANTKIEFYRPDNPDYYKTIVHDRYSLDDYNKDDFDERDLENAYEYEHVLIEKDYYSLYSVEVCAEGCIPFRFHLPYPVGKRFLPNPETLPHVKQDENIYGFRFGRALTEEEKIVYKKSYVEKMFVEAIDKAREFIKYLEELNEYDEESVDHIIYE